MPNLTKAQIIALIGFVVILLSVPLGSIMLKQTQVFKSKADELKKKTTQQATIKSDTATTKSHEIPALSPLSELQKQLEGTAPTSVSPTPTTDINLAFGPTLTVQINIEGRPKDKQAAKVFIGVASETVTTKPKYLLTFTVDFPDNGIFKGLSLAGLNPGSAYTVYVKGPGQIDKASTFAMSPTESIVNNNQPLLLLSGDLNEDNNINTADYTIAKSLYGTSSSSANWNERADFNKDGIINNIDLSYITKNFGKTGDSGVWFSPVPPPASGSANLNISSPSGNPTGGYEPNVSNPHTGGYWMWIP